MAAEGLIAPEAPRNVACSKLWIGRELAELRWYSASSQRRSDTVWRRCPERLKWLQTSRVDAISGVGFDDAPRGSAHRRWPRIG